MFGFPSSNPHHNLCFFFSPPDFLSSIISFKLLIFILSLQVVITKCYHLFCNPCVQKVTESRHRKCPGCAASFSPNDVKPVYIWMENGDLTLYSSSRTLCQSSSMWPAAMTRGLNYQCQQALMHHYIWVCGWGKLSTGTNSLTCPITN